VVGSDKNRKIVEKQAEELARQYAGVYKPGSNTASKVQGEGTNA